MTIRQISLRGIAAGLVLSVAGLAPAHAAFIATYGDDPGEDKNDCSGQFGKFPNCIAPAAPGKGVPHDTPIIVKIEFNSAGTVTKVEINPLFPSITGSELTFTFGDGGTGTGTWTYAPGADDPDITAYVAKGGAVGLNYFSNEGDYTDVPYFTPPNPSGKPAGLSHLSFYDSDGDLLLLPEPGSLALLGLGLVGIAVARRRRD